MHHHGAGLRAILTREGVASDRQGALVAGLQAMPASVDQLTARERALVAYAEVLTRTPWAVTVEQIDALREVGLDDRAIHDACAVIAYFAFVNRIADGLGVEVEGG